MSRSRMIDKWEQDLRGLTDQGVLERLEFAQQQAARSLRKGIGRNPKAARMWRDKADQAETELERRGIAY